MLSPATLWVNLEDMMLSERNQTQKHTQSDPTHRWSWRSQSHRDRKWMVGLGAGGGARE